MLSWLHRIMQRPECKGLVGQMALKPLDSGLKNVVQTSHFSQKEALGRGVPDKFYF